MVDTRINPLIFHWMRRGEVGKGTRDPCPCCDVPFVLVTTKLHDSHLDTTQWLMGWKISLVTSFFRMTHQEQTLLEGWPCASLIFTHCSILHDLMCSGPCFPSSLLSYHMTHWALHTIFWRYHTCSHPRVFTFSVPSLLCLLSLANENTGHPVKIGFQTNNDS